MKKYIKLIAGVAAFVLLFVGANALYTNLAKNQPGTQILVNEAKHEETEAKQETGQPQEESPSENQAIDFTVENADGEEVTLYSFIGKPIVLNFWASWCGPCKMELPDFQSAYETYGKDVEFILVNMTDGVRETKESAMEFMESEGYTMPVYYDTQQNAAYTYAVYSLPTTYFIDESGEIIAGAKGMLDAATLEQGISMIY